MDGQMDGGGLGHRDGIGTWHDVPSLIWPKGPSAHPTSRSHSVGADVTGNRSKKVCACPPALGQRHPPPPGLPLCCPSRASPRTSQGSPISDPRPSGGGKAHASYHLGYVLLKGPPSTLLSLSP